MEWGEGGTFRIAMNDADAAMESFVIGVWGRRRGGTAVHSADLQRRRRHRSRLTKRRKDPTRKRLSKQVRAQVRQDMRKIEQLLA